MDESQIVTLEDLRKYIEEKYNSEWRELSLEDAFYKQDEILRKYRLSQEEYEYVAILQMAMEQQSVKRTIINTKKAQQILVLCQR